MNILIALYDSLDNAKDAVSKLKDSGLKKKDFHLAVYEGETRPGESEGIKAGLSGVSRGGIADRESQAFMKQLSGWGVPEEDAPHYAEAVRRGYALIVADTPDDKTDVAEKILNRNKPVDIQESMAQWRQQDRQGIDTTTAPSTPEAMRQATSDIEHGEEKVLPVTEEELQIGKRAVQRGGVRVYAHVTERPVEETVNLRDESVQVERRPVDRPITDADRDKAFQEQSFEVTETDEEAVVAKQAHVVEEVTVRKDVEERPETISDTVRRTDVEVENLSGGQMRGTRDISMFDTDFHNHYDMVYGKGGHDFNYYEPAYRYGYALAGADRYRGKKWSEIEPDAQRSWERTNPQAPWRDFADAVRHAWERVTSQAIDTGPETRAGFTGTTGQEGRTTGTGLDETR